MTLNPTPNSPIDYTSYITLKPSRLAFSRLMKMGR